jgi:hypothetical protein
MKAHHYCVLACLIFATTASAQTNYSDYQKGDVILSEQFQNADGWTLKDYQIADASLNRTNDLKALAYRSVKFDESRDFEMEMSAEVMFEKGVWPKIYFGDYLMIYTCMNQFGNCNPGFGFYNKANAYGKYPTPNSSVSPTIPYTVSGAKPLLITFRKIGGRVYFFANKELVASALYKPFSEQTIGVHTVRMVDFITMNYLQKSSDQLVNEKPVVVQGNSPVPARPDIVKPGGKYYALLIGVSNYSDDRLDLNLPTQDARRFKELLVSQYSFTDSTTFLVLNPTRQKLLAELYRLRKQIGPNDNLLIFYAGHGYWDEAAQQGYWWPSDATGDDPSNWLSNSDVREQIRGIKSGHTLLISDACFSGGIFKTRSANSIREAGIDVQFLYRIPSRRAITSGTMTTVPDKSVFFEYLSKRLTENQAPFLTSQQLFDSFKLAVINNSLTVPQDGVIADTGDEGGDFVFIKRK